VLDATFAGPDLTTFCRLDELGLEVTGQRLEPNRAVLACRVVKPDQWCLRYGCQGTVRDSVVRRLAHEPLGWRPTTLEVTVRRYRCTGCGCRTRPDTSGRTPTTHAEVIAWVADIQRTRSAGLTRHTLAILSQMLELAVRDGRLARNVARGVRKPPLSRPIQRFLSHQEVCCGRSVAAVGCGEPSA
jgi:hypothetical protein